MTKEDLQDIIREGMEILIRSIRFPTGKALVYTFVLSVSCFCITFICSFLGLYTRITWQGSLIATIYSGALILIERREKLEISRLYSDAQSSIENLKRRIKSTNEDSVSTESDSSSSASTETDAPGSGDEPISQSETG